jgi:hypothetical protein
MIFKSILVGIAICDLLIIHHSCNRLSYRQPERAGKGGACHDKGAGVMVHR